MALSLELDFLIKSCRHFIGILAWTWAIIVFCLSYIGRGHYNNNNNNNDYGLVQRPPTFYQTVFVPVLKVLLVAPSASLAGPVPAPEPSPHQQTVVLPWGQNVHGGFVYCAGCSPINPQQLVIPSNVPISKAFPFVSASGVLPPSQIPTERQINGIGSGDAAGKVTKIWEDGAIPVQQMAMHDDGRYSFSYNTADAARQEERKLDGSVAGSYSYTDPEGKLVQIDYTAGPQGYNAFGENVPPQQMLQLPQPVRDTPEVQAAREKFLEAYADELAKHQKESDNAHTSTTVAPSDIQSSPVKPDSEGDDDEEVTTTAPGSNDEEAVAIPLSAQNTDSGEGRDDDATVIATGKSEPSSQNDENQNVGEGIVADDENDSIVISAGDAPENSNRLNLNSNSNNADLPNPSYQITIPFGVDGNVGLSVQQPNNLQQQQKSGESQPVVTPMQNTNNGNANPNFQPYFYYVSVGTPNYVTGTSMSGQNSAYPTSLKASLLGALPIAAVHDTQIPNRGVNMNMNMQVPSPQQPLYLQLGNAQEGTFQNTIVNGQMSQQQNPSLMNNNQFNNYPQIGQLFPIQLAPLGTHNGATFGYIPGLILNNGGGVTSPVVQQQQQQQHGSQFSNNMQMPGNPMFGFNFPAQQQQYPQMVMQQQPTNVQVSPSTAPTVNQQQPVIVLASKK